MVDCGFCNETFDTEQELHLHWGEQHSDELNSHQQDTYRKAKREQERQKESQQERQRAKMKKYAGYAVFAALFLGVVGLVASQLQINTAPEQTTAFNLTDEPVLGESDAPVTVVAFTDYRCPYCRQFELSVVPRLKQEFVQTGKIRFALLHFPFLGQGSYRAAAAAECVYQQDAEAFWEFHKSMYEQQQSEHTRWVTQELVLDTAREALGNLSSSTRQCIINSETREKALDDKQTGIDNGVSSTPTVFVNGEQTRTWTYGAVAAAIRSELP
ncbi:MAG: thioredoxin domain-containing protein [Candidatus Nanohaloarchaea archaeon]|nr:thioredoxin domain-containing protein [Candidatus Nanohaloarchaea archaeon]